MPPTTAQQPVQGIRAGIALQKAGNLLAAAQIYSGTIREDPQNADAWHLLGTIELTRGHFDAAHDMISQALTLAPDSAIIRFEMGLTHLANKQVEQAIEAWRPLGSLPENDYIFLFKQAMDHLIAGRDKDCVADLNRGVALNTEYPLLNRKMVDILNNTLFFNEDDEPIPVDSSEQ